MKTECYCGGIDKKHFIDDNCCFRKTVRFMIPIKRPNEMWEVNSSLITDYTLKHQRGYTLHDNDVWSKPKDDSSTNSLSNET